MKLNRRTAWYFRMRKRARANRRFSIEHGMRVTPPNDPGWLMACRRHKSDIKHGRRNVIVLDLNDYLQCAVCGNDTEYTCRDCGVPICEDHQAVYNQFTQIDYDCCVDCAENKRE